MTERSVDADEITVRVQMAKEHLPAFMEHVVEFAPDGVPIKVAVEHEIASLSSEQTAQKLREGRYVERECDLYGDRLTLPVVTRTLLLDYCQELEIGTNIFKGFLTRLYHKAAADPLGNPEFVKVIGDRQHPLAIKAHFFHHLVARLEAKTLHGYGDSTAAVFTGYANELLERKTS